MKRTTKKLGTYILNTALLFTLLVSNTLAEESVSINSVGKVDWPKFMKQHDMVFKRMPRSWKDAPHFGNAQIGSMLYQKEGVFTIQVFRAGVTDHRDDSYGWTAYSRPRLMIGHFSLVTEGKVKGGKFKKDLWNAELTGLIKTSKGEIKIHHYTHAIDMAIVTAITPSKGEANCKWVWHPVKAESTRGRRDYPKDKSEIKKFADKYGDKYLTTLKLAKPNPEGHTEHKGAVTAWVQNFLVGGQYSTAWGESIKDDTRTLYITIANSYPASTAGKTAVADIERFIQVDETEFIKTHRKWWHNYYPKSYVSIPDKSLESLYWQTIYRYACISRTGRSFIDTSGLWFQGGPWCYTTTDWNIQCAHWGLYAANRLEQSQELLDVFHNSKHNLIKAVRPVEWQKDSAYLPVEVTGDLVGSRDQDMRYWNLVGALPWTMNNFWSQYRFSMDDDMLRKKIYPLLRRSTNMYLHMVKEDSEGVLHLSDTYSPETSVYVDCNFDLALFKWSCNTLLKASKRLGIDDPLIPVWKDTVKRLPAYPADEFGFRLGANSRSSATHRHLSHLLMIYPLHSVNIEQEGTKDVLKRSLDRANGVKGLPAMVQSHAAPIAASLGLGDETLVGLKRLQSNLHPNGLVYPSSPCIESTLSAASIIQDMLIQSWSDPEKEESGAIRIFPALPSTWKDVEFHDLRTEGAFLVSAKREDGETQWVKIKSLAGEPCKVKVAMLGEMQIKGLSQNKLKKVSKEIYFIDIKKGEEVLLYKKARK